MSIKYKGKLQTTIKGRQNYDQALNSESRKLTRTKAVSFVDCIFMCLYHRTSEPAADHFILRN